MKALNTRIQVPEKHRASSAKFWMLALGIWMFAASAALAQPAAMVDTNILSLLAQGYTVVSPITNLPAASENPLYFSPLDGSDYVQQAVNSLPQYSDRLHVGGGKIIVIGQNFYPTTLIFTNILGGIMNFDVEAPMFSGGTLICATDPAIVVAGLNRGVSFEMEDMIISSLQNQTNTLAVFGQSGTGTGANVAKLDLENDWFGYWDYLTNNQDSYGWAGLTPTSTGRQITQRNLIISIDEGSADMVKVVNNSFLGIQSVYLSPDHCDFSDNFFSYCGGSAWKSGSTNTAWSTNSMLGGIFALGACVILGDTAVNQEQWYLNNNHFYGCYAGWYSQTGTAHVARNDYYELTPVSELVDEAQLANKRELPVIMGAANGDQVQCLPADVITNNNGVMQDLLTQTFPASGNQDTAYYSIPAENALFLGDQISENNLIGQGRAMFKENSNKSSLTYGLYTNAPYNFQILPSIGGGNSEVISRNGGEELDIMAAGAGDQLFGSEDQAYVPIAGIIANIDGTFVITNALWRTGFQINSNSVSANVPFSGSFVSFETNAANFAWSQIPPSSATDTNWWIGTFTNGLVYCIATNVAGGGYLFQKVTGSISTSP